VMLFMNRLKRFIGILLTLVLLIQVSLIAGDNENTQAANRDSATWVWHAQDIMKNTNQIIDFLVKNNVKDIYLQVDYELDLNSYKSIIEKAFANNINVHALEGSPEWVTDQGIDMQQKFFKWVTDYQNEASYNQQFRGIHLDVEPYLSEQYHSNINKNIQYYQDCLANALSQSENLGLSLSVSIPFWFDEVAYSTEYGEGVLAEWIISHVKNVVIMAYRDTALGDTGIISLVSAEMEWAKKYGAVIIVGVETQRSDEGNNIGFYEEGQRQMNKELNRIYKSYDGTTGFGGVAIHHLTSWMKLKKA